MLSYVVGTATAAILLVAAGAGVAGILFGFAYLIGTALIDWVDGRWLC